MLHNRPTAGVELLRGEDGEAFIEERLVEPKDMGTMLHCEVE